MSNDLFYGPTFEDAEESVIFPAGQYTVLVEDFSVKHSKEPNEKGEITYALAPKMKVLSAPDDKFVGKYMFPWWSFTGWSSFAIPRACRQAGLDEIDRYYNVKHKTYVGDDRRPVLKGTLEECYQSVAVHYMTGNLVDSNGAKFSCSEGGLLGQKLRVDVGKPNTKEPDNPRTGNVMPSKT